MATPQAEKIFVDLLSPGRLGARRVSFGDRVKIAAISNFGKEKPKSSIKGRFFT
jgi:hypothetical protein